MHEQHTRGRSNVMPAKMGCSGANSLLGLKIAARLAVHLIVMEGGQRKSLSVQCIMHSFYGNHLAGRVCLSSLHIREPIRPLAEPSRRS